MRSTGDQTFDDLLGGGIPESGTLLLLGESGSGKSRLATAFLNEPGDGLYLTADQPPTSVGRGLPLPDDIDRAAVEWIDDELVAQHADNGARTNITAIPDRDAASRVVVDGVDALADRYGGWPAVVDFIARLEESGAACIITGTQPDDSLIRHATIVVECWQEAIGGDYQSFCRVRQHRTAPHDGRRHRVALTADGAEVVARERAGSAPRLATDIDEFDTLTGGGFTRGGTTVFEHDGNAHHWPFTASVCAHVIDRGATVVCITAPGIVTSRMNEYVEERIGDVHTLMEADSLYVVDPISQAPDTMTRAALPSDNVIVQAEVGSIQEAIRSLVNDLAGQPVLAILEITSLLHLVEEDQARQLFYWASANVLAMEGLSLVLAVDRKVAGDQLTAFFSGSAEQVFRTWQADDGIQYLAVEKSPDGSPGHSRAVEPIDEPPYVRLR